jgi:uncharacterized protein (TIGR02453 family)
VACWWWDDGEAIMVEAGATPEFTGFTARTFNWFEGLEADNSKRYFSEHRETFEDSVRGAFEAMLYELADRLGGEVRIFRQHRDIRFSPDKSPYKTRTYGVITERPGSDAALYAQISAGGLFAATGYYVMARDQLERFREAVSAEETGPQLERAVAHAEAAGVEFYGETLKTAPRGYPRDHPRIKLLRHSSAIGGKQLAPRRKRIDREAALKHATATWAACERLNEWLERNVGPTELEQPPGRGAIRRRPR